MKLWWELYYTVQDLKCKILGHKVYLETRTAEHHYACKRGCGPVEG
jgi:hypothetical protein